MFWISARLQVGVALHRAIADDVGELELGQLPELRTIDRRAVAEANVRVGGERPARSSRPGTSPCCCSRPDLALEQPKRILRGDGLVESLDASTGDQPRATAQRDVDHSVAGVVVWSPVYASVGRVSSLKRNAVPMLLGDEDLLRRQRVVEEKVAGIRLLGRDRNEVEAA